MGCAAPQLDYKRPARFDYQPNLKQKAEVFESEAIAKITANGLLLYRWHEDFAVTDNFQRSHNLADGTAWQGYLIAALAFKAATLARAGQYDADTKNDISSVLVRLAGFFNHCYDISDTPGLLCRSALPDYDGPDPLPFMLPPGEDYWWSRTHVTSSWRLNRPNKDHVNMAGAGLSIALALNHRSNLFTPAAKNALLGALEPLVLRLVNDGYLVKDQWGNATTFPDFTPNSWLIPDGFNRVSALQLLAAVAKHGSNLTLQSEYEARLAEWGTGYAWPVHLVGWWTRVWGHWHRKGTPGHSNPQALAMAAYSFYLNEDNEVYRDTLKGALKGFWRFMKYEPNGIYTPIYLEIVGTEPADEKARMRVVIDELKSMPAEKRRVIEERKTIARKVQPIHNRFVDRNYWKANPFERARGPRVETNTRFAGMDFLLSYWMGRYFQLIGPSESGE